jgi:hypothetical protein
LQTGLGGLSGVLVNGQGTVIIRNCSIRDFAQNGVLLSGAGGTTRVLILNSIITGNGAGPTFGGVSVVGSPGSANFAEIVNSLIDSNNGFNIQVDGTGGTASLVLAGSILTGSTTAISAIGGGAVISYGNNVVRNAGSPTQTLPLQ